MTTSDDHNVRVWFELAYIIVEIFSFYKVVRGDALMALIWEPCFKIRMDTLLCARCNH